MKHRRYSPLDIARRNTTAALKSLVASDGKEEYRTHCAIVEALQRFGVPGLVFWHCPNGAKRGAISAARLRAMGMLAGVPDLALSWPGHMAFMEIKSGKGKIAQEQIAFLDAMRSHGHYTAVVRSLEEAISTLSAWGAIKRARVAA